MELALIAKPPGVFEAAGYIPKPVVYHLGPPPDQRVSFRVTGSGQILGLFIPSVPEYQRIEEIAYLYDHV